MRTRTLQGLSCYTEFYASLSRPAECRVQWAGRRFGFFQDLSSSWDHPTCDEGGSSTSVLFSLPRGTSKNLSRADPSLCWSFRAHFSAHLKCAKITSKANVLSECVSGFYLLSFAQCCSIWEACGHGPCAVTGCPGQHSASAFHQPDPWQSFPVTLMVTGTISFLVHLVWLGWASQTPNTKLHTHKENQADFQGYLSLLQLGDSCFALFWF